MWGKSQIGIATLRSNLGPSNHTENTDILLPAGIVHPVRHPEETYVPESKDKNGVE